jgi:hypothetical protein
MIVYGSPHGGSAVDTGALYDPTSNSWTPMASGPNAYSGILAGNYFVTIGNEFWLPFGQYDLVTGNWATVKPDTMLTSGIVGADDPALGWTGDQIVVWGGSPAGSWFSEPPTTPIGLRYSIDFKAFADTTKTSETLPEFLPRRYSATADLGYGLFVWSGGQKMGDYLIPVEGGQIYWYPSGGTQ